MRLLFLCIFDENPDKILAQMMKVQDLLKIS